MYYVVDSFNLQWEHKSMWFACKLNLFNQATLGTVPRWRNSNVPGINYFFSFNKTIIVYASRPVN